MVGEADPIPVPVANTGAVSTRFLHFRELTFGNELMTGMIAEADNPISRVTIANLEDIGYSVNYDAADSYQLPPPGGMAITAASQDRTYKTCDHVSRIDPVIPPKSQS